MCEVVSSTATQAELGRGPARVSGMGCPAQGRGTTRSTAEGAAACGKPIVGDPYTVEDPEIGGAAAPSTVLPRCAAEDIAGKPRGEGVHATAVAIGNAALLILGPSGAGKSRLAAALIAASTSRRRIQLIGDDRILLVRRDGTLRARPHPRIAGFLERRGFGIVAYPFAADVAVGGIVRLEPSAPAAGRTTVPIAGRQNFPGLPAVPIDGHRAAQAQRDAVLAWWRDARTTPAAKATADPGRTAKV